MSNSNINKLAKYIVNHVKNHGKYYGSFPVSNGYVFTAPSITKDHIYFHLEKNNHTQRIYVKVNQTAFVSKSKYRESRWSNNCSLSIRFRNCYNWNLLYLYKNQLEIK